MPEAVSDSVPWEELNEGQFERKANELGMKSDCQRRKEGLDTSRLSEIAQKHGMKLMKDGGQLHKTNVPTSDLDFKVAHPDNKHMTQEEWDAFKADVKASEHFEFNYENDEEKPHIINIIGKSGDIDIAPVNAQFVPEGFEAKWPVDFFHANPKAQQAVRVLKADEDLNHVKSKDIEKEVKSVQQEEAGLSAKECAIRAKERLLKSHERERERSPRRG